jgi:hypothetical protein
MPDWAAAVLAAAEPEQAEAGPTALLVVVLLGIGIAFLARSMIKHLRRVPATFDPPEEPTDEPGGDADKRPD